MSNLIECQDKLLNGVCTKGRDCSICNRNTTDGLDINSQEYVPKNRSKKTEENGKLNLNLQAKEYVPSRPLNIQNVEYIEEDDDGNDEVNQEEFDMIENDIINDYGGESFLGWLGDGEVFRLNGMNEEDTLQAINLAKSIDDEITFIICHLDLYDKD